MKTVTYSIIGAMLAILLGIAAWFFFKSPSTKTGIDLRLCIDVTDKDSAHIEAASIMAFATNGNTINEQISISTQTLSHYHFNDVQKFSLPAQPFLTGNSYRRKREVNKITRQLDTTLNKLYSEQSDKSRSNIFLPLLNVLNELAESKNSRKKILVVNSDLQEHTPIFNAFKSTDMLLLNENPDLIEQVLLQGNTIKNLKGIQIYFIHYPRNFRDDELYNTFGKFYKRLYEAYGAKVYVQSNLIIY